MKKKVGSVLVFLLLALMLNSSCFSMRDEGYRMPAMKKLFITALVIASGHRLLYEGLYKEGSYVRWSAESIGGAPPHMWPGDVSIQRRITTPKTYRSFYGRWPEPLLSAYQCPQKLRICQGDKCQEVDEGEPAQWEVDGKRTSLKYLCSCSSDVLVPLQGDGRHEKITWHYATSLPTVCEYMTEGVKNAFSGLWQIFRPTQSPRAHAQKVENQ